MTAKGVVNLVITNYGLFEITPEGMALREIAPGVTVDEVGVRALLDRVTTATGVAWTPLASGGGGGLADCLGRLLARRLDPRSPLPLLTLS